VVQRRFLENQRDRDGFDAAGVLVRLDGQEFLTTTTHTPVIFNSLCKKAWDELSVANRLSSMLGLHGTSEGWKMDIFIVEGKREEVCTLSVETVENCTSDVA
jgi:hypothetical protein